MYRHNRNVLRTMNLSEVFFQNPATVTPGNSRFVLANPSLNGVNGMAHILVIAPNMRTLYHIDTILSITRTIEREEKRFFSDVVLDIIIHANSR